MKKLLKYTFLLLSTLFFFSSTYAQEKVTLSGVVVNDKGELLGDASVKIDGSNNAIRTSKNGRFQFDVATNQKYTLKARYVNHNSAKKTIVVKEKNIANIRIVLKEKTIGPVVVNQVRTGDFIEGFPPVELNRIASTTGNFEDIIKVAGLGVSSNNELTANYNVRGGNYDENLIYVNGIEIYRPFLARSGQQEGLSFVNPAFVDNIFFSSGGFDSYYGDKLSSVLDIRYREPSKFGGSAQASFQGGQAHIEGNFAGKRGNYITGARYRANSYLLNSLPTQGDYDPTFFDYQALVNYYVDYDDPGNYKKIFALGHYSNNNYRFTPSTRTTSFGTVNEAFEFRVFFDGQEETQFQTFTAATGYEIKKNDKLKLSFIASVFRSIESETFDILGEYWINELETDPARDEFGDSTANVGIGAFLDHGRNDLSVLIGNIYHNGRYEFDAKRDQDKKVSKSADLYWGSKLQYESFNDQLSEWHLVDSSGFAIPQGSSDQIELIDVIKQNNTVTSFRTTGYTQFARSIVKYKPVHLKLKRKIKTDSAKTFIYKNDTLENSPAKLSFNIGTRAGFRSFNNEWWVTPRLSLTYTPRTYFLNNDTAVVRRNTKLRVASGLYYQPPLFRTLRDISGEINPDIVSQKSWHNVIGADVYFNLWGRPFKFITEAYYKHLWDVVPYEIDNVRIRYYGENSATAFAYGVDAKINGEFVKGVESFFRIGFLNTAEDIGNDFFNIYLNSDGDTIRPGFTFNDVATDSIRVEPGFIPRPTDQRLTFSVFFQDRMPRFEDFKVSANLLFGTPLPYGPPTFERHRDILRSRSYFRLDLGFQYDIINNENKARFSDRSFLSQFEQMTVSLDAFNLLGVNNIISYQWVQDIAGRFYAIPNSLTGRRINLRFIVKF